jgi:hypothetical protein
MNFLKHYFALKSANKWLRYHQKKIEKQAKIQKNHGFLTDFYSTILLMISQRFVDGFRCKIAF